MSRKLYSGPKLRRFREQHDLKQIDLAAALGISPSYLNQIENNQRPLTAAVLLKLSDAYETDLQAFSDADDDRLAAELDEILNDPLFHGQLVDLRELRDAVGVSPTLVKRFITLHRAYRESTSHRQELVEQIDTDQMQVPKGTHFPYEEVQDFFFARNNYIDELDQAAEHLQEEQQFRIGYMEENLVDYMSNRHNVRCTLVEEDKNDTELRRFDAQACTLYLCARQPSSRRAFYIAYQIGLLEHKELMNRIIDDAGFASNEASSVARVGLANYFAAALLMPYQSLLTKARHERYDVENLQQHYAVSFEAVCHRLSSMQRPGAKGIPFYFVRVDKAGNVSKRQSVSGFHFARSGGACALWNVHDAFSAPGKILKQVAQMPDGETYFCLARTVTKPTGGHLAPQREFAVGLGCSVEHAQHLIYSTGFDLSNTEAVVPIGPSCRACERLACTQRAFPPTTKRLTINEHRRSSRPFAF